MNTGILARKREVLFIILQEFVLIEKQEKSKWNDQDCVQDLSTSGEGHL